MPVPSVEESPMAQQYQQAQSMSREPRTNIYSTAVDLPEESRMQVIQTLNLALADTTDLQSQAKFAHWNVKGLDFYQLHLLFDEIAETLSEHIDMLAERVTALGGQAMGTMRIAAQTSTIPEPPVNAVDEREYLQWLTDHVAQHANGLRADIERAAELGDEDTADLFTELSREVDKQLYFLESHLQSEVRQQIPATRSVTSGPGTRTGQQQGTGRQSQQTGGQMTSGQHQMAGDQQTGVHGGAPAHEAAMGLFQASQTDRGQSGSRGPQR